MCLRRVCIHYESQPGLYSSFVSAGFVFLMCLRRARIHYENTFWESWPFFRNWANVSNALGRICIHDENPSGRDCCFLDKSSATGRTWSEGRCKATWKREFNLPSREAGPPDHHDDRVDSDQLVVNKELSLRLSLSLSLSPSRALSLSLSLSLSLFLSLSLSLCIPFSPQLGEREGVEAVWRGEEVGIFFEKNLKI